MLYIHALVRVRKCVFSPSQIGVMTGIALLVGVVYFQLGSMQFDNLGKNVSDRCVQHAHRTSLI